jgi:hypothetical protein
MPQSGLKKARTPKTRKEETINNLPKGNRRIMEDTRIKTIKYKRININKFKESLRL